MALKKTTRSIAVFCRAFMLLLVFVAIVMIAQTIVRETVNLHICRLFDRQQLPREQSIDERSLEDKIIDSEKEFLPDGTIHYLYYPETELGMMPGMPGMPGMMGIPDDQRTVEIYDTKLNKLWSGLEIDNPYEYMWQLVNYSRKYQLNDYKVLTPEFSREMVIAVTDGEIRTEHWRFHRSGYFVGYDQEGKEIGYIGVNGYSAIKKEVRCLGGIQAIVAWIPMNSYSPRMLWQTKERLYQIDFGGRTCELLFEGQSEIKKFSLVDWMDITTDIKPNVRGAVCIEDAEGNHIVFEDLHGSIDYRIPEKNKEFYRDIKTMRHGDDFYLIIYVRKGMPASIGSIEWEQWWQENRWKDREWLQEIYSIAGNGDVRSLNSFEWTVRMRQPNSIDEKNELVYERQLLAIESLDEITTTSSAIILRPIFSFVTNYLDRNGWDIGRHDILDGLLDMLNYFRPRIVGLTASMTLVCIIVVVYHGWCRRLSVLGFVGWLLFVGLFNVAGLLTYLAMNHRPVMRCAVCGKKRHLMGDGCVRCGGGLEVPEKKETDLVLTG